MPESAAAGVLFCGSLILGIAIGAAFDFIFASFMVVLEQHVYALTQIRDAVSFDAAQTPIPTLLDQAAEQTTIHDVETHRAPIDDVIADIYEYWNEKGGGVNQRI